MYKLTKKLLIVVLLLNTLFFIFAPLIETIFLDARLDYILINSGYISWNLVSMLAPLLIAPIGIILFCDRRLQQKKPFLLFSIVGAIILQCIILIIHLIQNRHGSSGFWGTRINFIETTMWEYIYMYPWLTLNLLLVVLTIVLMFRKRKIS